MKNRIYALFLSLLFLCSCCSCGLDKEPENTEPTDSFSTTLVELSQEPEPTDPAQEDNGNIAVASLPSVSVPDNAVLIDSINDNDVNIGLYFIGSVHSGFYSGTLSVRSQSEDNEDIYRIFENESFTLLPPEKAENDTQTSENGFLRRESPELLSFKRIVSGQTRVRLFELESDKKIIPITIIPDEDYADIILTDKEFISEGFRFCTNMYVNYNGNWLTITGYNDYALCCCDYGENRYIEYEVDLDTDQAMIRGSFDFLPDSEVTEAVKAAEEMLLFAHGYELSMDNTFEQYLTYLGENEEQEEAYYGISPELAETETELIEFFKAPFTEGYGNTLFTEQTLFGDSDPVFSADKGGLTYISEYRGVPTRTVYDSIRVLSSDESSAKAVSYGRTIDGKVFTEYSLLRVNGEWKIDRIEQNINDMGNYFGSTMKYGFDQWLHLNSLFNPFKLYAGEDFTVTVSTVHSGKGVRLSENAYGSRIICRFERAEDFNGTDLSELEPNKASEEYLPESIEETFTFNIPESGKYIFWAGCRYTSDEGETADIIAGPQIVHVKPKDDTD